MDECFINNLSLQRNFKLHADFVPRNIAVRIELVRG
jgi:hypothetical protein